jgi:cell division septum initiation protein DivIVA
MLKARFEADVIVPAQAESQRLVLEAQRQASEILGAAQAELEQLEQTVDILTAGGEAAIQAYIIANFKQFTEPMIRAMTLFEVKEATVISGAPTSTTPLSAIHPHPIEEEKARLLQEAFQPPHVKRLAE